MHYISGYSQTHTTKTQVAKAATSCMKKLCAIAGNDDIEPHIPMLVECMVHPDAVPACVQKLGSTTFVQDMTGPALAVMIPLLVRALNERNALILRPTSIIIDNLCKLVKNPEEAGQFLPQLLPGLEKIVEMAGNPEVRALAQTAKLTLEKVGGTKQTSVHEEEERVIEELEKSISDKLEKELSKEIFVTPFARTSVTYLSIILAQLCFNGTFKEQTWSDYTTAYLSSFLVPNTPLGPFYKSIYDEQQMIHKVF